MPNTNEEAHQFWPRAFGRLASDAEETAYTTESDVNELWRDVTVRMILMARVVFPNLTTTQQDDIVRAVIEDLLATPELRRVLTQSSPGPYVAALLRRAGREMLKKQRMPGSETNEFMRAEQDRSHTLGGEPVYARSPRVIRLLPVRIDASDNEADIVRAVNRLLNDLGFVARD